MKFSNITFHGNPSSRNRVDMWEQTDGYDEANSFFTCEYAKAGKRKERNIQKFRTKHECDF